MKRICAMLLVAGLLRVGLPAPVVAAESACPSTAAKLVKDPPFTLPPDAKISSKVIVFEADLGSDGRVRGLQLDQSSGDGAVDLTLRQALQAAQYQAPQTGCVAFSGAVRLAFGLPVPDGPHSTPPAKLNAACVPYVLAFLDPGARDRKRTGTAVVAVQLDAAATQSGTPSLRKSTGSPVLDTEALRIARTGQYSFQPGSPCAHAPFTYNLELTFK